MLIYRFGLHGVGVDSEKRESKESEVVVLKVVDKTPNSKSLRMTNARSPHGI